MLRDSRGRSGIHPPCRTQCLGRGHTRLRGDTKPLRMLHMLSEYSAKRLSPLRGCLAPTTRSGRRQQRPRSLFVCGPHRPRETQATRETGLKALGNVPGKRGRTGTKRGAPALFHRTPRHARASAVPGRTPAERSAVQHSADRVRRARHGSSRAGGEVCAVTRSPCPRTSAPRSFTSPPLRRSRRAIRPGPPGGDPGLMDFSTQLNCNHSPCSRTPPEPRARALRC